VLIRGGIWLYIAILVVAALGMLEFHKAVIGRDGTSWWYLLRGLALYAYFSVVFGVMDAEMTLVLVIPAVLIMAYCIVWIILHKPFGVVSTMPSVFSFFYVTVLLSFVIVVREAPGGVYLVWLVFISAWGADTCAYFAGKAFGRYKLCPALSPSKTVEGAIGGVLGAAMLAVLFGVAVERWFLEIVVPGTLPGAVSIAAIAAAAAVLSIFGDLTASAIKRQVGIKDYGSIFPGHGGVLDRFDSVLFTAPAIYIMLSMVIG